MTWSGRSRQRLTPDRHSSCPGHAAFVDADGEPVFVCLHPKDWGHSTPPAYRHRSKAEVEAAEEAAQALREYEQALAIADDTRTSFLTDYLTRKGKPPAGTLRATLTIPGRAAANCSLSSMARSSRTSRPSSRAVRK